MTTPLDLSEFGVSTETDTYAEDTVIDRYTEAETYDSFLGLDTRALHHSIDNPLNALYQRVSDSSLPLYDRKRAFDYMYRSSYVDKESICSNALLSVLRDESVPVKDRFEFLNSIRLLSSELSIPMNGYVWWFYQHSDPIRYKLLSAQFILAHPVQNFPLIKTHFLQSQRYLRDVAEDEKEEVQLRSEAADMLIRLGTPNFRSIGHSVIQQLGGVSSDKRKTLYNDEQNIHQVEYSTAITGLIKKVGEKVEKYSIDEILHHLKTQKNYDACDSLERIVLDTASYQGYTMCFILQNVYAYIQESPNRIELENRFLEELVEMKGWCSTGHVVRLLNTLSGFDPDIQVCIDVRKEIKSAVVSRLNGYIKALSQDQQEELANEFCSPEKSLLVEFIETYSPYEELLSEYRHIPREEFEESYRKAIQEYLG